MQTKRIFILVIMLTLFSGIAYGQSQAKLMANLDKKVLEVAHKTCFQVKDETLSYYVIEQGMDYSTNTFEVYLQISFTGSDCLLCDWEEGVMKGIISIDSKGAVNYENTYSNSLVQWCGFWKGVTKVSLKSL